MVEKTRMGGAAVLGDQAEVTMLKPRAYQQEMLAESLRQNIIVAVG